MSTENGPGGAGHTHWPLGGWEGGAGGLGGWRAVGGRGGGGGTGGLVTGGW